MWPVLRCSARSTAANTDCGDKRNDGVVVREVPPRDERNKVNDRAEPTTTAAEWVSVGIASEPPFERRGIQREGFVECRLPTVDQTLPQVVALAVGERAGLLMLEKLPQAVANLGRSPALREMDRSRWRGQIADIVPVSFGSGYVRRKRWVTMSEVQRLLATLTPDRAAREAFELIAPLMGHVDTTMVQRVYGKLDPALLAQRLALAMACSGYAADPLQTAAFTALPAPRAETEKAPFPAGNEASSGYRRSELNQRPWDYDSPGQGDRGTLFSVGKARVNAREK